MKKVLATVEETLSEEFRNVFEQIWTLAEKTGLEKHGRDAARAWEIPWVWFQLKPFAYQGLKLLDVGTRNSPLPFFLAMRGFDVTVSDIDNDNWDLWDRASKALGVQVKRKIIDIQDMDLPAADTDIYLSLSVMEHVKRKTRAIEEAARVLNPGGYFISTFDIAEKSMGMTFPFWNGRAMCMKEFDSIFKRSPWFEKGISEIKWNTEEIEEYVVFHRKSAEWRNYAIGGAFVKRNELEFKRSLLSKIW